MPGKVCKVTSPIVTCRGNAGVGIGVSVGVSVAVGTTVGVGVAIEVGISVGIGVAVGLRASVGVDVGAALGTSVWMGSAQAPITRISSTMKTTPYDLKRLMFSWNSPY